MKEFINNHPWLTAFLVVVISGRVVQAVSAGKEKTGKEKTP